MQGTGPSKPRASISETLVHLRILESVGFFILTQSGMAYAPVQMKGRLGAGLDGLEDILRT
jgi:hypothetical protein